MKNILKYLGLLIAGSVVGTTVSIALAQTSAPDRGKVGNELSTALNGADKWIEDSFFVYDGGAANIASCIYIGEGINVMVWCDGQGYVSNGNLATTLSADGGTLPVTQMVPVSAGEKYPMGLFANNRGYGCVRNNALQVDAGPIVQCHWFRRY